MDTTRDKMLRVVATRRNEAEISKKLYNESSTDRLFKILEKKFQTSFIGALSQFEQFFGSFWGHNKPEQELTPKEKEFRDKWNLVRTNVLNNGNNQIRAMLSELAQYTITWNRYQYNYPIKD